MIIRKLESEKLNLKDAFILKPQEFCDFRGTLYKIYTEEVLKVNGVKPYFVEEYLTISKKGVFRGFHYQAGEASQAKLIRCIRGEVYDVIIDMRKSSPTFGKWTGVVLSERNMVALYAPRGFAHGLVALTDDSAVLYKADNGYAPQTERGVIWSDPDLNITWPFEKMLISEKDQKWPRFKDAEVFP